MRSGHRHDTAGFTLMEVMVALGILAVSAVLLLESHLASLDLTADALGVATRNQLLELAVNYAELQVASGEESGDGDFGELYEGYAYSFDSNEIEDDDRSGLYEVAVRLVTPTEEIEWNLFVYVDALALE